jgi:RNA polymerase sigma factor (sigma-70 family)
MVKGQLRAVVRHIHRVAALHNHAERSDRELLEAFAAGRDQTAFAALVGRHGSMVLGVCRHVLHHEQDAEDAFQVTFLVLARGAATIRKKESLASWLHGVAYRTALSARRAAARRRKQEERVLPMTRTGSACELGWQDVQAVLQEELGRLPDPFRAAFILCCLEGRSRSDAARELGLKEGTVASRVERARKQLQGRLARRGVALSAVLCAAAISGRAGAAVPAGLAADTVSVALRYAAGQGAAGALSPTATQLLEGVTKTMFTTKLRVSSVVLLAAALAVAAGVYGHDALAAKPLSPPQPAVAAGGADKPGTAERPADAGEKVRVRGRVLDPDGKPVAGAKVYLNTFGPAPKDWPARAASGEDGRFEFTFPRSDLDTTYSDKPVGQVIVVAAGYGFDVGNVGGDGGDELTLRLVKDVPIVGRILDQEGKPVAGAKVSLANVMGFKGEDLTEFLDDIRKGGTGAYAAKGWNSPLPGQPASVATGADGKFRLTGIGRERLVGLVVEGPAIQYVRLEAMTRPGEPVVNPSPYRTQKIYGATFEYLASPSRPIRGVVRDKETGKPVAGVRIETIATTHHPVTDKEGRYELLGHAKSKEYHLTAVPAPGQPYFMATASFPDKPGFAPFDADIQLVRGITVRGRVTNLETGKPIRRAQVACFALYPNPNTRDSVGDSYATTEPDGTFAVVALPGPGLLAVTAPMTNHYMTALVTPKEMKEFYKGWAPGNLETAFSDASLLVAAGTVSARGIVQENYNALAMIEPDAKADKLTRDVALRPARTLQGTVTGPDGKPLAGATAYGLGSNLFGHTTLNTPEFTVISLNPRRTRQLLFVHKEKGLGYYQEIRGDAEGPLTIKLQPLGSASGRVVDKDGQPRAGLALTVNRTRLLGDGVQVKTDKEGRFRAEGLVPGQKYDIWEANTARPGSVRNVLVESGKDKNLGEVTIDSGN